MNESKSNFTVYFENPFWVGVFERIEDGKLSETSPAGGKKAIDSPRCRNKGAAGLAATTGREQADSKNNQSSAA